jgi:hypothetical protein
MVYSPPHPCACYLEAKLYGFNALAPQSASRQRIIDAAAKAERLERGPAYGKIGNGKSETGNGAAWPTFRGDPERSGRAAARVPAKPSVAWSAEIGGRLTAPVVAGGRLYVAAVDAHTVHALDAASGKALWHFTAGARVDSPPTVWNGRVLFGSADGYVYCLRAGDGRLAWRYRAAPADLRMGAFGQVESVWPVHGSVLVRETDGGEAELWTVAGRSMFCDGGLHLVRLDPATGKRIGETRFDDRMPDGKENLQAGIRGLNMPVALPDVLVDDGTFVYMRSQQLDAEGTRIDIDIPTRRQREQKGPTAHLFSPTGLLDDDWWHRSYWVYGRVWKSGAGGYYQAGRFAPAGRPMVFDDETVYSFGRKPQYYRWTTPMEYQLYATPKQPEIVRTGEKKVKGFSAARKPPTAIQTAWKTDVPVLVRAMVLAGDTLFLAGPPDLIEEPKTLRTFDEPATQDLLARQAAAMEGAEGAVLWAVAKADGKKLAEQPLEAVPVFDGLIAAGGRLYCATVDGRIIALGGK